MAQYLRTKILEVTQYYSDIQILEAQTHEDHMHILVAIPPKMAVSRAVNIIKSNTGRAMMQEFSFLDKVYWGRRVFGQLVILSPRLEWMRKSFVSTANDKAKKTADKRSLNFRNLYGRKAVEVH